MQFFVRYHDSSDLLVRAYDLSPENDIDKLSGIHGAYTVRLKEFIIDNSQVIIDSSLHDHFLHEIFHRRCIFMIYLHMLRFIEDNVCIEICKLIFGKRILIIQIHKNR